MLTKEVAKLLSISPSYVRHLFKEWCRQTGRDPYDFVTRVIVEAKDGVKQPAAAFDIPDEAIEWMKARVEKNRALGHRKFTPYKKRKEVNS